MVDEIFEAATVERQETFEEILVRVQNQVRNDAAVWMKCSNCDFEASDREDYYNHIVNNHVAEDESDEKSKTTDDSKTNIEEDTLNKEFEPMGDKDEEEDIVERTLDSILNKAVDIAVQRAEWEERRKNIRRNRNPNLLRNRNPNLLFSTLGSSQEPFDDDEESESAEEEEDSNKEESEEVEKKDASLDSLDVLKEQEKNLLDNIVKDLVELESLDIDILGGNAGMEVKENVKEEGFWAEENVSDFQDQYQIFAESLINPQMKEKTIEKKKNSKRKKLKAMGKKKKKMKRMKEAMEEDDEDEEGDENGFSATSSEVLRGLIASPAHSIGR